MTHPFTEPDLRLTFDDWDESGASLRVTADVERGTRFEVVTNAGEIGLTLSGEDMQILIRNATLFLDEERAFLANLERWQREQASHKFDEIEHVDQPKM